MLVGATAASLLYSLHLLNNDIGKSMNATCLDGSPGAFYFYPAGSVDAATKWQIYFEGGGWCYDELDCANRATGNLGSSKAYPAQSNGAGGILSTNCNISPEFCNYNKVYMKYCDGNSFSGNLDGPLNVPNGRVSPIYFRGHAILTATLQTLATEFGLNVATHVHLSGCSAGGLATYLHTNYVGDMLKQLAPNLQVYKSSPVSGFFLDHENVFRQPVYASQIQQTFLLSNASGGVDQDCIANTSPDNQWKCNFAPYVYEHIRYPIFVLNSAYDSWQAGCILTAAPIEPSSSANGNCSAIPDWSTCAASPTKCHNGQIFSVLEYESNFVTELVSRDSVFSRAGNGAFIHTCHTHCEAMGDDFVNIRINGMNMAAAVTSWWNASNEAASVHTYLPSCVHYMNGTNCNPSCGANVREDVGRYWTSRVGGGALMPEVA